MLAARSLNPDCNDQNHLSNAIAKPVAVPPLDPPTLELLDKLTSPVWLIDPNADRIRWTNRVGTKLFGHASRDELLSQTTPASELLNLSLQQISAKINVTISVRRVRTMILNGQEKLVELSLSRWDRAPDPTWIFVGIRPIAAHETDAQMAARVLQSTPCVIAVVSLQGRVIHSNPLAQSTFGPAFSLRSVFVHRADHADFSEHLAKAEKYSREAILYSVRGKRWYAINAERATLEKTNEQVFIFCAVDITARILAEQAKEELVSMVSHELRTPMTAIRGAVELLAGGLAENDPALFNELLGIASDNTKRLQKLVDALLDLRKLANGRISIALVPCNLVPILHEVINIQAPEADAKGIQVMVKSDDALPISGDEGRLQQVLLNLLSNAIKHSPLGATVLIHATTNLDYVRISVTDSGPGIPMPFQDRIFEPFSQADSSSTRTDSGMGLGLYMAKTLVELHGGRLSFTNRPEGGTTFTLELPRCRTS